jgi:hypothetical protein
MGFGSDDRSAAFTGCSALVGQIIRGIPWVKDSATELEEYENESERRGNS